MTPEQLKLFRERLATAKQPEHKLTDAREFLRGWNASLDAAGTLRSIMSRRS